MMEKRPIRAGLIVLSILLAGVAGCAPPNTQSALAPTLPPGWESSSAIADQGQCGYAIDHPSGMDFANHGTYSWILSYAATEPSGPIPNFIYISAIPDSFQGDGNAIIYNYDPTEMLLLLSMQVSDSRSLREDPMLAPWFTYTRLPNITLGDQTAQAYENTQPSEFPLGTKEIRYYLPANSCMYLIGGYLATVGSGQPGAIDEELFDQIIATFRYAR